jgi:putative phosphoribosyl transferase
MAEPAVKDRSEVTIDAGGVRLSGDLALPADAKGVVIFAHGSGSSRFSSRNRLVADSLNVAGLGTLLFDLLTAEEHAVDQHTREFRFDIELLSARLCDTVDWMARRQDLGIGLFGASTGAAAALIAAARRSEQVRAVVSRGGRVDLAGAALRDVRAPTLMVVGGNDLPVLAMNRDVARSLQAKHQLKTIEHASHLFEEPGTLEQAARLAAEWFERHLGASTV